MQVVQKCEQMTQYAYNDRQPVMSRLLVTVMLLDLLGFWATVCKAVRPMLSVRSLSVPSVLSVLSVCLSVCL